MREFAQEGRGTDDDVDAIDAFTHHRKRENNSPISNLTHSLSKVKQNRERVPVSTAIRASSI